MQENVNIPDSTITTNLSFRQLVLMNMQQLTNFPYIEKDFDALTDYELLCLVVKYLNDVIANQNEQNDSITRMYESFLALQTYVNNTKDTLEDAFNTLDNYVRTFFENLDVQDEIDHKLDEMVEDGTLEHIIASYLQTQKIYNTHVEMIADADNLVSGLNVQTLGYYTLNDGGGAFYQITNTESLTEYQEEVGDLYATLILDDSINVHQLGAKGDGETDDSNAINTALSLNVTVINFSHNKTYMVRGYETGQAEGSSSGLTETTGLVIPSNKIVNLNESTIKCITNSRQNYNIFTIADTNNIILKNGKIIGDRKSHTGNSGEWGYGISIRNGKSITLENLNISECWGDGINLNNNGNNDDLCSNIRINNCVCDSNRRQGMSIENGENIIVTNSSFINTGNDSYYTNPASGVDVEPGGSPNYVKDLTFDNCLFSGNYNDGLILDGDVTNTRIINCNIIDNSQTGSLSSIALLRAKNTIIENCNINNTSLSKMCTIQVRPSSFTKIINNNCVNASFLIYPTNLNNDTICFENNKFTQSISLQYNGVIETVTETTTNVNNTLIVKNNEFKATPNLLISAWIISRAPAKFKRLYAENNIFKFGKSSITSSSSSVIKNNSFIANHEYAILLFTGDNDQIDYFDSNIFEGCGYNNAATGVIYNNYNVNIIMMNNSLFKKCLSSEDNQSGSYSPTRFLQTENPSGLTLDANNNVFNNS